MDQSTEKLIRENAQAEHLLLTPVRWAQKLIRFIFCVLFFLFFFTFHLLSWVVGCGNLGWRTRQERADKFVNERLQDSTTGITTDLVVNLASRGLPDDDKDPGKDLRERPDADHFKYRLDTGHYYGGNDYTVVEGIPGRVTRGTAPKLPLCARESADYDPGMGLTGLWNRSQGIFMRKHSRMYEAYITGVTSVTTLRVTLAKMKLRQYPWQGVNLVVPGEDTSLCHADPFREHTISPENYTRWVRTSKSIAIDAPSFEIRWVPRVDRDWEDHEGQGPWPYRPPMQISGMCIEGHCNTGDTGSDDLKYYVTAYSDLFDPVPPLSEHQVEAVNALLGLANDDFWLRTAHANGIYDDRVVLWMAQKNRGLIRQMITPGKTPHDLSSSWYGY